MISRATGVAANAVILTAGMAAETLLQFVFILILGRQLGPETFGYYGYLVGLVTLAGTIVHFGLPVTVVREMSQRERDEPEIFAGMFRVRIGLAIIFFAAAFLFYYTQPVEFERKLAAWLIFFFLLTLPFELATLFDAKKAWRWDVPGKLAGRIVSLIAVVIFWKSDGTLSLYEAALATALLNVVYVAVSWSIANRIGIALNPFAPTTEAQKLLKMSAPMAWGNLMITLYVNSQILFVKWFSDPVQTGYYALVLRLLTPLLLLKGAVYRILIPLVSDVGREPGRLQNRLERVIPNLDLLFMPLSALGIIAADVLIVPLFGADYAGATLPTQIVIAEMFFGGPRSLYGSAVFASGNAKPLTTSLTLGSIVAVAVSILLAPKWGATGAAIGYFSGSMLATYYNFPALYKICKPDVFPRTIKVALPCIVAVFFYFALTRVGGMSHEVAAVLAVVTLFGGLAITGEISRRRVESVISMFRNNAAV